MFAVYLFLAFIIMTGEHYTERLYEVNIHLSDFKISNLRLFEVAKISIFNPAR